MKESKLNKLLSNLENWSLENKQNNFISLDKCEHLMGVSGTGNSSCTNSSCDSTGNDKNKQNNTACQNGSCEGTHNMACREL